MSRTFRPKPTLLHNFLEQFWFAPQDVLLRSVEASIMSALTFRHPILDIGIGDASIADLFYPKKLLIEMGVDIDAQGIERAKTSKKYKKIQVANAEKLPFKNSSFATVICNSTCEHITKDAKAISEMGRVLKKGGTLYLTVPSAYLPELIHELERFEGNDKPKQAVRRFNQRVAHKHYRSLDDWKKVMAKAKLEVIVHKYYFPKMTTWTWYRLMRFSITKFAGREMWSWIGHSRFTNFIPSSFVKLLLEKLVLRRAFILAFDTHDDVGGMLYLESRKK